MTRARIASVLIACASLASADRAHADDADAAACADAANAGQPLRRGGRLRAARAQFLACSRAACPEAVRERCIPWVREVDAAMPTVVVRAHDDRGADVAGARTLVDGEALAASAGVAGAVDPGTHRFRVEAPDAASWEDDIVIVQGEKNRVVLVTLTRTRRDDDGARPPEPASNGGAPLVSPTVAYALGAVGVVAVSAFVVLEVKAHDDDDDLRNGCGVTRTCAPSSLTAVKTESAVALVAGGIGVVSLAASALFLLWRSPAQAKRAGIPALAWTF